jgi:ABC-type antimicrobial peptide transport system permease subunit
VVAALGLKALLKAFGIVLPSAPLVFEARTAVVAIAVGVGVTLLSAIVPARRVMRIPPVAALVELSEDQTGWYRVAALLGTPGRLGQANSTRTPRRTAQTAAALMVGLSLVSTIAVLGASLSTSAKNSVDTDVSFKTRAQFEASEQASVNQLLGLVYVLLALAILIALIGIINTLMLSVFERTHEIGLLRAVGMNRRQVRTMIRTESVIVALFGGVVRILRGLALGVAFAYALRNNGVTSISVPIPSLIGFVIFSALLGLVAAAWPARRAANLDVLAAIATE